MPALLFFFFFGVLLFFLNRCLGRVEGYFEGHAHFCIPCTGGLDRVEESCTVMFMFVPCLTAFNGSHFSWFLC